MIVSLFVAHSLEIPVYLEISDVALSLKAQFPPLNVCSLESELVISILIKAQRASKREVGSRPLRS